MNKKTVKPLIKLLIITVLIFGFYYSNQVEPVEDKRVESAIDNFSGNMNLSEFEFTFNLERDEADFYKLEAVGWMDRREKNLAAGEFSFATYKDDDIEAMGEFIFNDSDLYFKFFEEDLSYSSGSHINSVYGNEIIGKWVRVDFDFNLFTAVSESKISVSEAHPDEEIDENEVFHYELEIEEGFVSGAEVFLSQETLLPYRVIMEDQLTVEEGSKFSDGLFSFPVRSKPHFSFEINFQEPEDGEVGGLEIPEEYIDL